MSENITLPEVDAATARQWLGAGEALLLDVREVHEYEFENVPGALLLPLSFLDADSFPSLGGVKVVIMCAIGKRSAAVQKQLVAAGFANLYNLTGGIDAWKKAGFETQGGKYEAMDFSI